MPVFSKIILQWLLFFFHCIVGNMILNYGYSPGAPSLDADSEENRHAELEKEYEEKQEEVERAVASVKEKKTNIF